MARKKLIDQEEELKLLQSNSNQLDQIVSEGHVGFLKADEYWHWRHSISEWRKAEAEHKVKECQLKLLEKESEIFKLRSQLFGALEINSSKTNVEQQKKVYEEVKKQIEERLHQSLNDCIINDVTYEISRPQTSKSV